MRRTKRPRASSSASSAGAFLRGQRDEQAAGRLRVEAERQQLLRDAVRVDVRRRELAVPRVAAGLLACARHLERAVERGPATRASSTSRTPLRSAVSCAWPSRPKPVTSVTAFGGTPRRTSAAVRVQRPHPADRGLDLLVAGQTALRAVQHEPGAERLRQEERVAGPRAGLRPDPVGMHGADDGEPVLRLLVADRVAAGEDRARLAHLLVGRGEDRGDASREAAPRGTRRSRARAAAGRPSRRRR